MLLKPCNRCKKLIPYGKTYCDKCESIVIAQREQLIQKSKRNSNRRYNKTREPKYIKFYNSKEWKMLSLTRLQQDNYRCIKCGAIASEVDHIIPIQTDKGWNLRLDFDNTQSLCLNCNNQKHNRFKKS